MRSHFISQGLSCHSLNLLPPNTAQVRLDTTNHLLDFMQNHFVHHVVEPAALTVFGLLEGSDPVVMVACSNTSDYVTIQTFPQLECLRLENGREIVRGPHIRLMNGIIQPTPHYSGSRVVVRRFLRGPSEAQVRHFFRILTAFFGGVPATNQPLIPVEGINPNSCWFYGRNLVTPLCME